MKLKEKRLKAQSTSGIYEVDVVNEIMMIFNDFEKRYQGKGFYTQQRYPKHSFLAFLGENYFSLPFEKRMGTKALEFGCGTGENLWREVI